MTATTTTQPVALSTSRRLAVTSLAGLPMPALMVLGSALAGAVTARILPHITLHTGSPWWVIALGLPVAAVLAWAMSTVWRHATTGERGRFYPLALAISVVTLLATCLLVFLLVAVALQGGQP